MKKSYFKEFFLKKLLIFCFLLNNSFSFFNSDFFSSSFARIEEQIKAAQKMHEEAINSYANGNVYSTGSPLIHFEYVENLKNISIYCYLPEFISSEDLYSYFENDSFFIEVDKEGFLFKSIIKEDKYILQSAYNQKLKDDTRGQHAHSSIGQSIQQSNSFSKLVDIEKIELSFKNIENCLIIDIPHSEKTKKLNFIPIKIIEG